MLKAQAHELAKRFGVPIGASGAPQDLLIVGMGKLGGRELNVSSDIDLVFLYDEDGETRPTAIYPDARRSLTIQEFYERLARRLIPALNDIEGPGFVFRVDMRLRPNGDSGPIVCSSDMLETYLYTQGRDWERFAWLKGRVINTPVFSDGETFSRQVNNVMSLVKPFVFRKYLDFGAITSLTKLHEMIRAETTRREIARKGSYVNVKLGRGGIREIEFLTQTLQVIRGGRDSSLRGRETLLMLDALAKEGAISSEVANKLKESYVFLRDVEHAIQYVNDEQTQRLSRHGENLPNVAGLLGIQEEKLWERLEQVNDFVSKTFDSIFQTEKAENKGDWPLGWETGTSTAASALVEKLTSFRVSGRSR
ncbi:bifunctional glutamine-synthetase adenylyltransferase/deadenyltransferase [gut metagenome]|uniref:Bifunctional glutamine-synthetase adenylyltransferase/deadenyltransferase n=1 Tax=gut metagenome TaxID=749906 RepID=J9D9B9_9ZZZZ